MKTLILNGSPKRNGDTAALIREFTKHLNGDVRVVSSHFDNISPCLEVCDNLVIASPVWFSELSGPLLTLASRIQTYFAAKQFRNQPIRIKHKNGILILVGAEKGTEEKASSTAHTILKHMNALPCIASVFSLNTNDVPAADDLSALDAARNAALLLNQLLDES